jgi:Fascin domain
LESNEFVLQKAMKSLRGMTWSGMMYNMLSWEKPRSENKPAQSSSQSVLCESPSSTRMGDTDGAYIRPGASSLRGSTPTPSRMDDEIALGGLLSSVSELHSISLTMGQKIETQNATLERLEQKGQAVEDQTLAVTLKAAQLTQRSSFQFQANEECCGYFQFVDTETGLYLAVDNDGAVVLTDARDRSTLFKCLKRETALYGIQNEKTLKFLSSTFWGPVRANGFNFNRREECHVDLGGSTTGIFFVNTKWGAGGWLQRPADTSGLADSGVQIGTVNASASGSGSADNGLSSGLGHKAVVVDRLTKNISDKTDMLVLRVISLGQKDPSAKLKDIKDGFLPIKS